MFYNINENRKIKNPFLAKDICVFCYNFYYEISNNKVIAKPFNIIGTNDDSEKYPDFMDIINKYFKENNKYLVIDNYLNPIDKRSMPNDIYLFLYREILDMIKNKINHNFLNEIHIIPIINNDIESFVDSKWIIKVIEEGIFILYEK